MIVLDNVHKRYQTAHGMGPWVLKGISLTIPPKVNVGLIGRNGAGKSTLLRLIGGTDQPDVGRIERQCRVSWRMGRGGSIAPQLTGRQNTKFVCRIMGHEDDIPHRMAFIEDFCELGPAFDEPIYTYSSGMTARLQFALTLAFDFDVYISDESISAGDATFRSKAKDAFEKLAGRASVIMVSHGMARLRQFCSAGIFLHEGRAHWFDNLEDAFSAYRDSLPKQVSLDE
jgi:capsular polysaccharide transport system ATP-binding protein